jgi:hypothetical protein
MDPAPRMRYVGPYMPPQEIPVESLRHPAIQTFLEWARDAISRDPAFRSQVEEGLSGLSISPKLRRQLEEELDRIAAAATPRP